MKLVKAVLITLSALLFTGCYTQLEYSQRMSRVSDHNQSDQPAETHQQETVYAEETAAEEYIPVYYKDYDYVDAWNSCGCNIYNNYTIHTGNSGWYGHHYSPYHHRPSYAWNPYSRWRYGHHFGHRYYGSSFGFSLHWGSPYYDRYFYDPFYYDHFAYGYSPMARNYYIFYGQPGMGYYGGKVGNSGVVDQNRSYRPRSVGTSRVADTNSTRSRSSSVGHDSVTRSKSTTVRTRSTGTTRSRGTVTRTRGSSSTGSSTGSSVKRSRGGNSSGSGTVTRSRGSSSSSSGSGTVKRTRNSSGSSGGGSSTTRSRGNNIQADSGSSQQQGDVRTRSRVNQSTSQQQSRQIIRFNRNSDQKVERNTKVQNRLRGQTTPKVTSQSDQKGRSSFLDRVGGVLKQGGKAIINSSSKSGNTRLRTRSSNNTKSSVTRSKGSSNNRSSVKRSRSSSNNKSSSGSSSRSRSGGSDRSRGN